MKSPNANFFFFVGSYFEIVITIAVFFFPICSDRSMTADLTVMGLGLENFSVVAIWQPWKKYFYGEPGNAQLDPEVQISRALLGQALGHSFP